MSDASSEWQVRVARLTGVRPHPNADSLDLAEVDGYPVIVRRGSYVDGQLVTYVPRDSVVPEGHPLFAFLGNDRRIRPKRLRGIFSDGLVVDADPSWEEGRDVAEELGVVRYEPVMATSLLSGRAVADPGIASIYDVHALRRYKDAFREGDQVVVTEKIHGTNARFALDPDGKLWVGSRNQWKMESNDDLWWRVAHQYSMDEVLREIRQRLFLGPVALTLYGEIFGPSIQRGFSYGVRLSQRFVAFDLKVGAMPDSNYLDWPQLEGVCASVGFYTAPVLYRGGFSMDVVREMAEGPTTLGGDHVREGVVVRSPTEAGPAWSDPFWRRRPAHGRWVLKYHGEGFLLKNGG